VFHFSFFSILQQKLLIFNFNPKTKNGSQPFFIPSPTCIRPLPKGGGGFFGEREGEDFGGDILALEEGEEFLVSLRNNIFLYPPPRRGKRRLLPTLKKSISKKTG